MHLGGRKSTSTYMKEQAASCIIGMWPEEVPVLAVMPYAPENLDTSYRATTIHVTGQGKWNRQHYNSADVACHLTDGAMHLLKASTKARLNELGVYGQ
jgi:hypothetical protein